MPHKPSWMANLQHEVGRNRFPERVKLSEVISAGHDQQTGPAPQEHADHRFFATVACVMRRPVQEPRKNMEKEAIKVIAGTLYEDVIRSLHELRRMQLRNNADREQIDYVTGMIDELSGLS